MRNAYALLGLSFLIVFVGAYLVFERAHAPEKTKNVADKINEPNVMKLTSPSFEHNGVIPAQFTCDGDNINPELHISDVPEGTASLVLVMDDSDIPKEIKQANNIEKFDHWVLYNILPDTTKITAGDFNEPVSVGVNSAGDATYRGPCPPTQYEPTEHRYSFRLYALPHTINFIKAPTLDEVESIAKTEALANAELIGRYERPQN